MDHVISIEQSPSTKFERTNAGETSRGHDQLVNLIEVIEKQSITVNHQENEQEISNERQKKNEQAADWKSTAKMYLRSILDDDDQPKINNMFQNIPCPKVPPRLRNSERSQDYFDPKIVSFGPYHHGKAELQETQMIKTKVMRNFVLGHGKTIEDLYIKVHELKGQPRSCYVDGSTDAYSDEAFALMMLQDGCFILFLIEWGTLAFAQKNNLFMMFRNRDSLLMIANHLGPFELKYLYRDMLLLENQIPFVVLKDLMSNIYNENEGLRMIKSYLYMTYLGNFQKEDTQDKDEGEPNHLLELLKTLISKCRDHHENAELENKGMDATFQSFGSFSNLQAKGINLKPSNSISLLSALLKEKPNSICLRDVDFRSGFFTGELKLPPLFGGNNSQEYYANLIAFELCDYPSDLTVTNYINFMNSLIANHEDVKALRSELIILHALSSDEEVFKMLKEMAAINLPQNLFMYLGVKAKIKKHCKNKIKIWIANCKNMIKIWIAEARHKYFSQPWSIISLMAAVFVIILTFLQTFYTINPPKA